MSTPGALAAIVASAESDGLTAGESVGAVSSQRVGAAYACGRVLSESVASTPLVLYRREGRNRNRAVDHPLYRLLHDAPNGFQTLFEWLEQMMLWLLFKGDAVYLKSRVRGELRELLPIEPAHVEIESNERWVRTYKVQSGGFKGTYGPADVLHIKGLGDGFKGRSVIENARVALGLAMALDRHGSRLFAKGARPSGILTTIEHLDNEVVAELRGHFAEQANGIAVLDSGLKFEPITMSSVDAQFLETRKFQVREVARMFRVPPHKIGDLDNATFSNIEHQSIEFVTDSLMPWFRRIEQAINKQVVGEYGSDGYYAEFLVDSLLRGDSKARADFLHAAILDGWMNRNEAREVNNLNPADGLDEFLEPRNMAPAGTQTVDATASGGNAP